MKMDELEENLKVESKEVKRRKKYSHHVKRRN